MPPPVTARNDPWASGRLTGLLLGAMTVAGMLVFFVVTFGHVSGEEFSAESFRRRSYEFYQIPLLQWQVCPAWRTTTRGACETYLVAQKLVQSRGKDRWDPIAVQSGGRMRTGSSQILMRYLEAGSGWERWSVDHPALARPLWRAVQDAARRRAYTAIPELFDIASRGGSHFDLAAELDRHLASAYAELGDDYVSAGRGVQALPLYEASLQRDASNETLRRKLGRLRRQLGRPNSDAAERSRAPADKR